jgi:phage terminase small subunit
MGKLTVKQENFCQEYIKNGGNATDAYRKSYNASKMKENSINVNASKLLSSTKVALRIKELQEKTSKKHEVTRDWIISELKNVIGKSSQEEVVRDKEGNPIGDYKYDSAGINKAIDTLNKMLGFYAPEKQEHSGEIKYIGWSLVDE